MNTRYQPLFEPASFRSGVKVNNRVVLAPMTNFASDEEGTVTQEELDYYARRCGGVGLAITACAYVTRDGKGFPGEFGADHDGHIPSLRRLAETIKKQGATPVLQIFHGGRQCPPDLLPSGQSVSASSIPSQEGGPTPRALEGHEVEAIVAAFGEATRRAIEAGFDGVEIHGANGYLVQQFFSPHANRREDRWGGSLEKRLAFPLAVVDAVQQAVSQHAKSPFLVGYRFSPEEPETPGITMEDTFALVDALAAKELDYLHVSLMEFWSKPRRGADPEKPRITHILERVGGRAPVIGVGSIHTADEALEALQSGVDFVALGRELIMEPDWVEKVVAGRESEIATTLTKDDQERLVVPDALWKAIIHSPGWFPVVEK